MFVVALTSLANADASTSKHESGRKLHEVADLVLDQQAPPGDSAVWVDGLETPVAPLSSVTGCTIINLHQGRGRPPADRGRPAPQGPHRPPATSAPSAPASSSRRPTTTTAAGWACSIAEIPTGGSFSCRGGSEDRDLRDASCRAGRPRAWSTRMALEQLFLMIGLPGYFSQWTRSRERATLVVQSFQGRWALA